MSTISFIIAVYDLTEGNEVTRKEYSNFAVALEAYSRTMYNWERPLSEDDPYPFGVLMFTSEGDILYGFGED